MNLRFVNYGAPTRPVTTRFQGGGFLSMVVHDGPDGHEQLQPGEQCECGQLGFGIIRDSEPNRTNIFQPFYEEFASIERSGIYYALPEWKLSRWARFKIWMGFDSMRMKPCVPVSCPLFQEVEINWTGLAHDYVPGSFAADAAAFYAEDDDE